MIQAARHETIHQQPYPLSTNNVQVFQIDLKTSFNVKTLIVSFNRTLLPSQMMKQLREHKL